MGSEVEFLSRVPSSILVFIGLLVLANIGSIFSVFAASAKIVWWASDIEGRVKRLEEWRSETDDDVEVIRDDIRELQVARE